MGRLTDPLCPELQAASARQPSSHIHPPQAPGVSLPSSPPQAWCQEERSALRLAAPHSRAVLLLSCPPRTVGKSTGSHVYHISSSILEALFQISFVFTKSQASAPRGFDIDCNVILGQQRKLRQCGRASLC